METYDLAIENVTILTMDALGTTIGNGAIGVVGGTISFVGEQVPGTRLQAKERIDGQGMIALPGFVNTHVHCFQSLLSMPMHDPLATLAYSASAENIDTTIVNGNVVYRKGVFACGIDEEQLYHDVMAEMRKAGLPGPGNLA